MVVCHILSSHIILLLSSDGSNTSTGIWNGTQSFCKNNLETKDKIEAGMTEVYLICTVESNVHDTHQSKALAKFGISGKWANILFLLVSARWHST